MNGGQHWGTGGGVALGGCLHWGWPRVSRITLGPYPLPLAHIIVRVMAPEKDNGHSRMGAANNNFGYRVAAGQTEAESGSYRRATGVWDSFSTDKGGYLEVVSGPPDVCETAV